MRCDNPRNIDVLLNPRRQRYKGVPILWFLYNLYRLYVCSHADMLCGQNACCMYEHVIYVHTYVCCMCLCCMPLLLYRHVWLLCMRSRQLRHEIGVGSDKTTGHADVGCGHEQLASSAVHRILFCFVLSLD